MAVREPIYVALATLLFTDPRIVAAFPTTGRFLYHEAQIPGGSQATPAMYIVQHPGESHVRIGKGVPDKRTLRCSLVMYFNSADPSNSLPATLCNIGLDVLDDVINLPNNPGNVQTLGGLCEHVYWEGETIIAEGLLQGYSIVAAPLTILIP